MFYLQTRPVRLERSDRLAVYVAPEPGDQPRKANGVRVAFLLQLNGRASRQVKRLLKLIYRPWHYYYVHVDARQDFMHRQMMDLQKQLHAKGGEWE